LIFEIEVLLNFTKGFVCEKWLKAKMTAVIKTIKKTKQRMPKKIKNGINTERKFEPQTWSPL